jgi:septal ring factor EnvC (AmiA/AmiB activator)
MMENRAMNIDPVHLAFRSGTAESAQKVLNELEAELAAAKQRRDKILADISKANDAAFAGDKRQLFALGALNKEDAAVGRLILSIQRQIAEAKKRVAMAENQAAAAKAAESDVPVRDKLFEVVCPDGRKVRHRGASQEDVRRRLQVGYTVAGQVHGADADGNGGFIPRPGFLTAMLEAYEGEFIEWLEARGISGNSVKVILPSDGRESMQ